ncbi:MFS transporter [Serratia marcescens]|uniref:MFS transporter n=1 Tax=Serratia marcescens TaxID=615 RepID=UPI003328FBC2
MKWSQRIGVVSGNAMEFYDIAVYAAISPYLSTSFEQQGFIHGQLIIWGIFAIRFLIRPFGGIIVAQYAKRNGRKSALILTSTLTGSATILMAVLPINALGFYLPLALLILQMVQAFSFGGEYPAIINYLINDCEKEQQGRISSLIVGSSLIGVIFSELIVLTLKNMLNSHQMMEFGWRIPLFIGGINILISFWFRTTLPFQKVQHSNTSNHEKTTTKTVRLFLLTIPAAVVFYIQNLASSMISAKLLAGPLKETFPLINTSLLLVTVISTGQFVDRFTNSIRSFNFGIGCLFLFGIPLYYLSNSESFAILILSILGISVISAMILSNLAAALKEKSEGDDTSLGLGYNMALSLFGGLTPIIVHSLIPYGIIYVGIYISLSAIPVFFERKLTVFRADI